jgi:hypothetical protein
MQSMIVETDMEDVVGSSYGWATTKIGQVWLALFAQRKWNGEQLFDELGQVRCNSYQYI